MQTGGYQVEIRDTGERYECAGDQTLLAGMESLGRRGIPVGCRGGGCGICKVQVLNGSFVAGKMSRGCLSDEERAGGVVLACRVQPTSDVALQVVGRMLRGLKRRPDDASVLFQTIAKTNEGD